MTPEAIAAIVAEECARFEGHVLELLRTNQVPADARRAVERLSARVLAFLGSQPEEVIDDGSLSG